MHSEAMLFDNERQSRNSDLTMNVVNNEWGLCGFCGFRGGRPQRVICEPYMYLTSLGKDYNEFKYLAIRQIKLEIQPKARSSAPPAMAN
jgi:hypothetical protein